MPWCFSSGTGPVNVGSGEEISILALAKLVASVVGCDGEIVRDLTKPDGTPRNLVSSARLSAMGWHPGIGLKAGIACTYAWYLEHVAQAEAG